MLVPVATPSLTASICMRYPCKAQLVITAEVRHSQDNSDESLASLIVYGCTSLYRDEAGRRLVQRCYSAGQSAMQRLMCDSQQTVAIRAVYIGQWGH